MSSGPQVRHLPAWHSTICFWKYLTLCKILYLLDQSWVSYKLLFVRQAQSSITPGGKPSHRRSCHLEADLLSRFTDSIHSVFLSVSVSLSPFSISATPQSAVRLYQTAPASICDFQSISGAALLMVVSVSVLRAPTAGGIGSWIQQGRKLIEFKIYIKVWQTLHDHSSTFSHALLF